MSDHSDARGDEKALVEDMRLDDRWGPDPDHPEPPDTERDEYLDAVMLAAELGVYEEDD